MSEPRPGLPAARTRLLHQSSKLFHHLFTRVPGCEFGLSHTEHTRLMCSHRPLAGRRAVHLSDLHLDRYLPRHDRLLSAIADLRPDWVFITGDLMTIPRGVEPLFRFLSSLRAIAPVYLTLGNHDHYSGVPLDRYLELADQHKVYLLVNQLVLVPFPGGELAIAGLDDPSLHRADPACIPPRHPGRFTVVLAHAPNVLDLLDHTHAADLILCGHSHGGQCRLPPVPTVWLPHGCNGRASGLHERNGHRLYVNRGIGWSMLPIRWLCPPEIVIIEWE